MKTSDALITDIQRFCMHDGPGIRTTVFFKGCPLQCRWCHNPETQNFLPQLTYTSSHCISCAACQAVCESGAHRFFPTHKVDFSLCKHCGKCADICPTGALELSGKRMTAEEIMKTVMKDSAFYGKNGGITVSGGEPTAQSEALLTLLSEAKVTGISACIETCGMFSSELAEKLVPLTDIFLFDIKDTDEKRLFDNTGAKLEGILSNLRAVDTAGGKTVLRCIMIPEVNMDENHGRGLAEIFGKLKNCLYLELLPYHPYGNSKAEGIGITAPALYRTPEKDEILAFAEFLRSSGVRVKCFGSELR